MKKFVVCIPFLVNNDCDEKVKLVVFLDWENILHFKVFINCYYSLLSEAALDRIWPSSNHVIKETRDLLFK